MFCTSPLKILFVFALVMFFILSDSWYFWYLQVKVIHASTLTDDERLRTKFLALVAKEIQIRESQDMNAEIDEDSVRRQVLCST
jgi:hypothetical protein